MVRLCWRSASRAASARNLLRVDRLCPDRAAEKRLDIDALGPGKVWKGAGL